MELSCPTPSVFQTELPTAPETQTTVSWPVQVLLVEDNAEAAWLAQVSLTESRAQQFRVEWSQNLFEAMTRLAQPGIEVVLLDLGLPELNGYKSFRAIDVAAEGKIPVVILTSDDSRDSRDLTLGFGASDYLIKDSISPARLRAALVKAVHSGRSNS
jgi:two-component system catabolic regulation response regulator CreB